MISTTVTVGRIGKWIKKIEDKQALTILLETIIIVFQVIFFERKILLENQQKTKNYAIYKIYTYMYIPPPAVYTCTNTIHNT